jgi:hypothetical protein
VPTIITYVMEIFEKYQSIQKRADQDVKKLMQLLYERKFFFL